MTATLTRARRGPKKLTVLPLVPLMEAAGTETCLQFGDRTGLNRSAVQQLKGRGVPIHRADRLCAMLGLHPIEVWGMAFYEAAEHQEPTP